MQKNILLIGTGNMALEYAKVLKDMRLKFIVVGRGEKSAQNFEEISGIKPISGGFEKYITNNILPPNTYTIITTGTEVLLPTLLLALRNGAGKVLIEKPAALSIRELLDNEERLLSYAENVYIAYNRRFYTSVIEAKRLIEEDGGLLSMYFEFTEWAHKIEPLHKAPGVKENWFFANSSHVIDLAFFIAGIPFLWQAYSKSGKLSWHSKTNFAGAGVTDKGVLFSYLSNWESAGRWGIELLTEKRRIYLRPLESLSIQQKGSLAILEHIFDDSIDKRFKPGLKKQVEAFLNDKNSELLGIKDHLSASKNILSKMIM